MNLPPKAALPNGRRLDGAKGFTLVEVMVATVLLSMIILGILAVLIGSYRVAAKARYRDHARYIIKSYADQFLTQQTTDISGNLQPLFTESSQTAYGLSWTNSDGTVVSGGNVQTSAPVAIAVQLGDNTGAPITALVSRTVWYLIPGYPVASASAGQVTSIMQNGSAGYLLRGDFNISYTVLGTQFNDTISATRSVP
jgi:type II secretory pathway pseudopilin PulG